MHDWMHRILVQFIYPIFTLHQSIQKLENIGVICEGYTIHNIIILYKVGVCVYIYIYIYKQNNTIIHIRLSIIQNDCDMFAD